MQYKYYLISDWASPANPLMTDWPVEGRVEVQNWDPDPVQDGGIRGYLHEPATAEEPSLLLDESPAETSLVLAPSKWVVLGSNEIVRLDEQRAKCPWGMVLHCGNRLSALAFVDMLRTRQIKYEYLGDKGHRSHLFVAKPGISLAACTDALVIGGSKTTIEGGDQSTLVGGRQAHISGGNRTIVSGGKGARLDAGNKAVIAGSDLVKAAAGHSSTVVGGYKASVYAGTLSTVVGGYKSTVTGGYGATVVGGEHASVIGGDHATVIGGDNALVQGGKYAQVFGGVNAVVSGGIDATLRLAYINEAGDRETSTAYVGRFGILPDVWYMFDGTDWCPAEVLDA